MLRYAVALLVAVPAALVFSRRGAPAPANVPVPITRAAPTAALQVAYLAGGCFWGVEAVYEHIKGVTEVVSGYAGGKGKTTYEEVSAGRSGHAEAVRVTFDPAVITYDQILRVFFSVVHDPTQLNRQGPDVGPQYRSAIFFANADQQRVARAYVDQLTKAGTFDRPIVTQLVPAGEFFVAEAYHQDFAAKHPDHPYIVYHDQPKVAHLKRAFPDLFRTIADDR